VLSDYLDGDLPPDARARVEGHLRGCEGCARFGGEFQATVRALRDHLSARAPMPEGLRDRIHRALDG
jgi:anti-sigma factor RsiW